MFFFNKVYRTSRVHVPGVCLVFFFFVNNKYYASSCRAQSVATQCVFSNNSVRVLSPQPRPSPQEHDNLPASLALLPQPPKFLKTYPPCSIRAVARGEILVTCRINNYILAPVYMCTCATLTVSRPTRLPYNIHILANVNYLNFNYIVCVCVFFFLSVYRLAR